jgi:hypothetical protein
VNDLLAGFVETMLDEFEIQQTLSNLFTRADKAIADMGLDALQKRIDLAQNQLMGRTPQNEKERKLFSTLQDVIQLFY